MAYSETMKRIMGDMRAEMKTMLAKCTPEQQDVFRRMYNHKGEHEHDVDGVKDEQLDWAFYQLEQTAKKNDASVST